MLYIEKYILNKFILRENEDQNVCISVENGAVDATKLEMCNKHAQIGMFT